MDLKKSILKVFLVNVLSMITGITVSFIVPAMLSIAGYSELKTFNFYLTYTALLSLGFVDGMYIKYGGKTVENINKNELKLENIVFLLIQGAFAIVILIISFIRKDIILVLIAICIVPSAIYGFFTMVYQSVGEFNKYTKIMICSTIFTLLLNLILVFLVKSQNYLFYCLIPIITNGILFIYLEAKFIVEYRHVKLKYDKKVWNNIKIGFFVLLGNLSVVLFYGIDRWFIKIFYSVYDFAYYSFAVSMLGLVNLLISAVSITMYNHIARDENKEQIKKIKDILLIIGVMASLSYFVFAGIINIFLKKYIPSLNVIAISFAAYPYMIPINAIFVNLYKSRKQEKKYFRVVGSMLILVIVYNAVAMLINHSIEAIALATTLGFITWYIYSMKHFDYLRSNLKEIIFLGVNTISFLILSNEMNWLVGGIIYLVIVMTTSIILYRKILIEYGIQTKKFLMAKLRKV